MSHSPLAIKFRLPMVLIGGVLLVACAACSASGGGTASAGNNYGNTGGSVTAECADFTRSGVSGDTAADRKKLSEYWDRVAKDAPPTLKDAAISGAQAADKLASGDKSATTSAAFLKGVAAYATWFSKNCKLKP